MLALLGFDDCSDFLGAAGSFLLLIAPVADQVRRLKSLRTQSRAAGVGEGLKAYAAIASDTVAADLSRWRWWESLTMGLGAILLMLSFWI